MRACLGVGAEQDSYDGGLQLPQARLQLRPHHQLQLQADDVGEEDALVEQDLVKIALRAWDRNEDRLVTTTLPVTISVAISA